MTDIWKSYLKEEKKENKTKQNKQKQNNDDLDDQDPTQKQWIEKT